MDDQKFEKTIKINDKEVIITIDKKIDSKKSKEIIDSFCRYLKDIKSSVKNVEKYKASDFDYIVLLLVIYHCTDFLKSPLGNFLDVTIKYSEMVTKNTLHPIMRAISGTTISSSIDKIIVSCRVIVQNEISIKRLEDLFPQNKESKSDFQIIKLSKDNTNKMKKEDFDKFLSYKKEEVKSKSKPKKKFEEIIDELLDQYNDAMFLYEFFQDNDYKKKAHSIMSKIKRRYRNEHKDVE